MSQGPSGRMLDILFMALMSHIIMNYFIIIITVSYIIIITVFDFLIPNKEIIWNQT